MEDDLGQLGELILLQAARRTAGAQAGDDAPRPVVDRRSDAPDGGLMLALVDGIAAFADQFQLALELSPVGYRGVREALQSAGDDRVDSGGRLEGKNCLADARAMDRRRLDQRHGRSAVGRYAMDDDRLPSIEYREMNQMTADPPQRIDERARLAVQVHVGEDGVAEFEQLDAEPIAITMSVLVEQAHVAQGGRQSMRRAAREAGCGGDLRQRQRSARGREGLQN